MNSFLRHSKAFVNRNGSTILTCIGGIGVVVTSVMAVKATPKALALLEKAKEEKGEALTKFEKVRVAGTAYVPAVVVGTSTIACIFGANALNKRQQAALMSAYALLDSSYKDYKKKVEELYGEDADENVRGELAKDKYDETKVEVDKQLFYDEFSERYFESTMEKVLRAEYDINRTIQIDGGAFLNEFYEFLDIPTIEYGDYMGWSACEMYEYGYGEAWLDFGHQKVVMDDGLECYIISFSHEPSYDFLDY